MISMGCQGPGEGQERGSVGKLGHIMKPPITSLGHRRGKGLV